MSESLAVRLARILRPTMFDPVRFARAVGEKVKGTIDERIGPLERRVAALEQRSKGVSGVEWAGVFEQGKSYAPGQLVTRNGGLWLALRETTLAPGTTPTCWRLICKEGRAHE